MITKYDMASGSLIHQSRLENPATTAPKPDGLVAMSTSLRVLEVEPKPQQCAAIPVDILSVPADKFLEQQV